jgi:hypothetical protein
MEGGGGGLAAPLQRVPSILVDEGVFASEKERGRAGGAATHEGGEPHAGHLPLRRPGGRARVARGCSLRGGRRCGQHVAPRAMGVGEGPPPLCWL